MSYCITVALMEGDRQRLHQNYHDLHYGFPISDDNELFGRLLMEINQAGLSWETILRKEANFRLAYAEFNIEKVAAFNEADRERLMADKGIIRNKLKINAAIENAKTILILQKEFGSFQHWLLAHHPLSKAEWLSLFKRTFKFTGGEIVGEFLMSIGFLKGAHDDTCPIQQEILKAQPQWLKQQ